MKKKVCLLVSIMMLIILVGCGNNGESVSDTGSVGTTEKGFKDAVDNEKAEFEAYVYKAACGIAELCLLHATEYDSGRVYMDSYKYEMMSDTLCKITVTYKIDNKPDINIGAENILDTSVDNWYNYTLNHTDAEIGEPVVLLNGGATDITTFRKAIED